MNTLQTLDTPALLIDCEILDRNIERMGARMKALGVRLRPHVKTAKSLDVVRRALGSPSDGITVSTLKEADYFFSAGISDILYTVGIAPGKLAHVIELLRRGASVTIALDNMDALRSARDAARSADITIPVVIEIDVDGHRSGVAPASYLLLELGREAGR